jgi:hypothetical protein
MNGAANRRRGHVAERRVAAYLREHGYPNAQTSRAALGHDGTRQPGDVIHGPDRLVVSVKDVAASCWPTWCRQAREEADGRPWVVVRKLRGAGGGDVGQWPCVYPRETDLLLAHSCFAQFLEQYDDKAAA